MKRTICATLLFSALFPVLPLSVEAQTHNDENWAYDLKNGIEKSRRSYLLVYSPEEKEERRIKVKSDCEKPHYAEGTYGKCTHNIVVYPGKKELVIKSGEDVVLLHSPTRNLILSTLEYGCCAGPDTARFYAEDGSYLGLLKVFQLRESANYDNVITRIFDMRNATENYLVVTGEGGKGSFEAIVFEKDKPLKKVPISFTVKDKDACEYWHLGEFQKYGDRDFITLMVKGSFCHQEAMEDQEFNCSRTATAITCTPLQPSR